MAAPPLILASESPRRRSWLEAICIPFEAVAPQIDEAPLPGEDPLGMVARLSGEKAASVAADNPGRWVLAADTIVVVDGNVLGKPADEADAVAMLRLIQGRGHLVHTGVCLARNLETHRFTDTAEVTLRPLTLGQIRWYVSTGEPMDKAGAYAAQGIAALFIERIDGSFSTVMGLPMERLGGLFFELGLLETWYDFGASCKTQFCNSNGVGRLRHGTKPDALCADGGVEWRRRKHGFCKMLFGEQTGGQA